MTKSSVPLTNHEVLKVLMARERQMNEITSEFFEYLRKIDNNKTIQRDDPDTDYEIKVQNANLIE